MSLDLHSDGRMQDRVAFSWGERSEVGGRSWSRQRWVGAGALAVAATLWGATYGVVKDILADVSLGTYLMLRFAIAVPIVAVLFRRSLRQSWSVVRDDYGGSVTVAVAAHAAPGLVLAAAYAAQGWGIRQTSPGIAAFLSSLMFCFLPLLDMVAGDRRRVGLVVPSTVLGVVGVTLIWGEAPSLRWADAALLSSAFFYALQIFLTGRLHPRHHPALPLVVQGSVVALSSAFLVLLLGDDGIADASRGALMLRLVYVSVVATVLCFMLQFWAQQHVRARYVGVIYLLEPVVALGLSASFGHQLPSSRVLSGCAVTSVAIALAMLGSAHDLKEGQ